MGGVAALGVAGFDCSDLSCFSRRSSLALSSACSCCSAMGSSCLITAPPCLRDTETGEPVLGEPGVGPLAAASAPAASASAPSFSGALGGRPALARSPLISVSFSVTRLVSCRMYSCAQQRQRSGRGKVIGHRRVGATRQRTTAIMLAPAR